MKKPFFGIASFILILIMGGGLAFFNVRPIYSDSPTLPIIIGGIFNINGAGTSGAFKVLTLPDSSGWMKVNECVSVFGTEETWEPTEKIFYLNLNNAFLITALKEKK